MIDLRFRPLKHWPKDQLKLARARDAFKTGWLQTLDNLEHELKKLRATQIIVEAGFSRNDMTIEEAAGLIVGIARPQNEMAPQLASMVIHDRTIFNAYYREAAAAVHPDATGGDRERWDRLEIAKGVLEKHHDAQENTDGPRG